MFSNRSVGRAWTCITSKLLDWITTVPSIANTSEHPQRDSPTSFFHIRRCLPQFISAAIGRTCHSFTTSLPCSTGGMNRIAS